MTRATLMVLAVALVPAAAAAQTPAPAAASSQASSNASSTMRPYASGVVGVAAVQKGGALVGAEIGVHLGDTLDVFAEGSWLQDVVTRRRLDRANAVTSFLQTTQGKTATGTITAPAGYGGAGARVMLMSRGTLRPFIAFGVGGAHVTYKPSFTLGGGDVTASLATYGVSVGADITGDVTKLAFTAGPGVRYLRGSWFVDGTIGVISIRTPDEPTNVLRAAAAFGVTF